MGEVNDGGEQMVSNSTITGYPQRNEDRQFETTAEYKYANGKNQH
ncbi:hypothetical protein EMQU_1858 [Enterococcus mundtii QU 25]|nr:hypothetical protein EMQU_1858 [Enterococcus mundtii QU 25]